MPNFLSKFTKQTSPNKTNGADNTKTVIRREINPYHSAQRNVTDINYV